MNADLITQFKDQPNTLAIMETVAEQFQSVYEFFEQLSRLRWIDTAEGTQLDGIGDIVVMSRAEAARLAGLHNPALVSDLLYRLYLKYKIFLNTSNGTYKDVLNGLKMFVPDIPLYYTEEPEHPATMYFDTPDLHEEDIEYVFKAPIARAAGVQVIIRANTRTPIDAKIKVYGLHQFRLSEFSSPPWVVPQDVRGLRVFPLRQFRITYTEPSKYALYDKQGRIGVEYLRQFSFAAKTVPQLGVLKRTVRSIAFRQVSYSQKATISNF
jgi:hypothetical protein